MSKEECVAKGCTTSCRAMMHEVSKQITIEKSIEDGVVTVCHNNY
jgi:hypothetical protein